MRTLIVGLGQIGMGYDLGSEATRVYSHARAFSTHPDFDLVAGVDPDPARREAFERAYARPAHASLQEAGGRVDAALLVLAVPTSQHLQSLRTAVELGRPRAVLCEKPLAHDLDEARGIVDLCRERGTPLFVNYVRRSDPGVAEVRRRLSTGEIASPVKGVAWYSKGLIHNGSHFFNLLDHWLGPMSAARIINRGRLWDGLDPEPDVFVSFEHGEVHFLAAREEHFPHYTVELVAPNGRLRYEQGGRCIEWQGATRATRAGLDPRPEVIASGLEQYQWHVADQLAAHFHGQPARLCAGDEALRTLAALKTIVESK